jgi:histidine triad (HIT) family protein
MCLFCDIVTGRRDAHVVHRDENTLAFLDIRPLFPGHCLLVPVEHHETLHDLPTSLIEPLFGVARRLSEAVRVAAGAEGSFVAINNKVSQSVPHLHVHVVPRVPKDGLRGFFWPRKSYGSEAEMAATAAAVTEALATVR